MADMDNRDAARATESTGSDPEATPDDATEPVAETESTDGSGLTTRAGAQRKGFGSIQSKLLIMLLATSVLSSLVIGYFGYRSGSEALEQSVQDRLSDVRDERAELVRAAINGAMSSVRLNSHGAAAESATQFDAAYRQLTKGEVAASDTAKLRKYYNEVFAPRIEEYTGEEVDAETFVPTSPARTYLQANYTVKAEHRDEGEQIDDAGDGSRWSAVNKKYNAFWREVREMNMLDDVMMINTDGDVIYTTTKRTDLGSNVVRGELGGGALEEVWSDSIRANSPDFVAISDYERYAPAHDRPTMFVASAIPVDNEVVGTLVFQVSAEAINSRTTGEGAADVVSGLGDTGEVILVAQDGHLRSISRLLVNDPDRALALAEERGVPSTDIDTMRATESSTLLMPASDDLAELATRQESGVTTAVGYYGHDLLAAYEPLGVEGLDWGILAVIESDEALSPVSDFVRNLLLATAAVILLLCGASVLLARVFTEPVKRLLEGVRAVAGGKLGTQVATGTRDEFGDLGAAFNDLSASLQIKQDLIDQQQREHSRVLQSFMPPTVAERYLDGEHQFAAQHRNASVVYTEVEGFDVFTADRSSEETMGLLENLAAGFDAAATRAGIEKVRSVGTGYVGSSGLAVQRVDHARRVVDFAIDVARMIERFNQTNDAELTLRAGLHLGDVSSGLLGGEDMVYNLWGEAVDLAYRLPGIAGEPGIFVTDEIKERLSTGYSFARAGEIDGRPFWQVEVSS